MPVHRVDHHRVHLYVFIIPQVTVGQWRVIGAGVNRAVARIDYAPAAFRSDLTHGCTRVRHLVSRPERVRRTVKTIRRSHGADPDRFEKNIVTGISAHAGWISSRGIVKLRHL